MTILIEIRPNLSSTITLDTENLYDGCYEDYKEKPFWSVGRKPTCQSSVQWIFFMGNNDQTRYQLRQSINSMLYSK